MVNDSEMATFIVKDCCRTLIERLGSMVDVGGGNGRFSKIISEAFPASNAQYLTSHTLSLTCLKLRI